jgi:hypothetical protein
MGKSCRLYWMINGQVESYGWRSGDWENMGVGMQELRCNGMEVMWHENMTWRKRRGCGGRHSGDNNNTGGDDIGDKCQEVKGGGEREM